MCLAVVARSRHALHENHILMGRSAFSLAETTVANIATAQQLERGPVTIAVSMDKDLCREFLTENRISVVRTEFGFGSGRTACIELDNVKQHSFWNNRIVREEARRSGLKLRSVNHPAN